jgi:hypothetical protein
MQIIPIDPNFDQETIDRIKARKQIKPIYELKNVTENSPTPRQSPTVIVTPTIEPTLQEPSPTIEQLPTSGGALIP